MKGESAKPKGLANDRNGGFTALQTVLQSPTPTEPPAMPDQPETTPQFNAEILADRARRENKKRNLARYAEGMTPRAAWIEGQRAKRRQAVEQNIKAAEEAQRQETRAAARLPRDPQQEAASAIFQALKNGDERARRYAAQVMKAAPDELRRAVMQLAEVDSQWKQRRSRKTNGF